MIEKDNSGPAFPTEHTDTSGLFDGMTLRDYFAAKAMAALLDKSSGLSIPECLITAADAYAMADAMLKARRE